MDLQELAKLELELADNDLQNELRAIEGRDLAKAKELHQAAQAHIAKAEDYLQRSLNV